MKESQIAQQITSIKDHRVVEARALTSSAGRTTRQRCLLEGAESIQWALEAGLSIEYVFYQASLGADTLQTSLTTRGIPCYSVSDGILKRISDTSYLIPWLGVARLPRERTPADAMGDLVIVLDRVQDHGNIGTIIRTARAFGVEDVISTGTELDLYYKKIVSASRGKVFDTHLWQYQSGSTAIATLKQRGYQIVATSPHARDLQSLAPLQARPVALLVGNETDGITDELVGLADLVVQIPMSGLVESLNVGVATGISLYELKFRLVLGMLTRYIRANFGREVNVTSKMIMQAFDTHLQRVPDLNGLQVLLLMILKCDQQMTLTQVSKDMGTFGEELDDLLRPLFEKGCIVYASLPAQNSLVLTAEGERLLAQLWNVVEHAEQRVLAGFSESEQQQLNAFLQRIQANCAAVLNEKPVPHSQG